MHINAFTFYFACLITNTWFFSFFTTIVLGFQRVQGASGESSQHHRLIGKISIEQQRGRSVLHYPFDHFHHTSVLARLSSHLHRRIMILLFAHSPFLQQDILDFWRFSDLEKGVISIGSSFWKMTQFTWSQADLAEGEHS